MNKILADFANMMWGPWLLISLVGAGIWLTIRLKGIQFRTLFYALRLTFAKERTGKGDISHFGALMTALAATVGMGNIAGVATAVALGGPGAIFWMWITGLVGMATKFAESLLAVKYRQTNEHGEISGGPMYYLEHGLKQKWLGVSYAAFGAIAGFGLGNMVQSNTIAIALNEVAGINKIAVGLGLAILTGMVIIGGIKRIADVCSYLVPFMLAFYMIGALSVIGLNLDLLASGIGIIFDHAFTGTAAVSGFVGATLAQTIRFGVSRGVFSNESGLGSASIAAAAAKTNEPTKQALVSMTGTFIDTLVVCSITAIVLATTGVWESGETGIKLTMQAFSGSLPGYWGNGIVISSGIIFGFSSILGWQYYGEKCFEYLFGNRWVNLYRYAWVFFVFFGAVVKLEMVWNFSDGMNALMAVPNLIGLFLLTGIIIRENKRFEEGIQDKSIGKYD